MRTSAPGSSNGFTLLELLVALLVAGIGLGAAVLALRPDPGRPLALEAERLQLLLAQAREESELGGRPIAWVAESGEYRFQRRELSEDGPVWRTLAGDALFHPRPLPQGMRLVHLQADGRPAPLGERLELTRLQRLEAELEMAGQRRSLAYDAAGAAP